MTYSISSYFTKVLMMAIAIISLASSSHADLRQQVNIEKSNKQIEDQCAERIKREALFGDDTTRFTKVSGNSIYEVLYPWDTHACSWKWTKRAEIGVERIYNSGDVGYKIPYREVWHIEGSDVCRYYNQPGLSNISIDCYNLKTGSSSRTSR